MSKAQRLTRSVKRQEGRGNLSSISCQLSSEKVTAYDRVKLARDAKRPHIFDFINALYSDFEELHGDRLVNDDQGQA